MMIYLCLGTLPRKILIRLPGLTDYLLILSFQCPLPLLAPFIMHISNTPSSKMLDRNRSYNLLSQVSLSFVAGDSSSFMSSNVVLFCSAFFFNLAILHLSPEMTLPLNFSVTSLPKAMCVSFAVRW